MPACHAGGHGFESRTHRQSLPRCVSSAWLECLPVTQEVTGSSPVRTAERDLRVSFLLLVRPVSYLVPLPAKYCKSLSVPTWSPPHSPLMPPSVPPWGKSGLLANKAYGTYRTYMANERVFRCSPPLGRGRGWVGNMTHIGFLFGIDHAALACLRFSAGKAAGCCCSAFVLCE